MFVESDEGLDFSMCSFFLFSSPGLRGVILRLLGASVAQYSLPTLLTFGMNLMRQIGRT